jgi:dolichol-phosphate mannosyltransferase
LKVAVVIPTFNERDNVGSLVERLVEVFQNGRGPAELIFVNDMGSDRTEDVLLSYSSQYPFMHVIMRNGQRGLARSYLEGIRYAKDRLDPDVIVQMDGDFQHPPEKIPDMVKLIEGGADVVLASRYVQGSDHNGWGRSRVTLSRFTNAALNVFLELGVHDSTTGFRALDRRAIETILEDRISAAGFAFQVETLSLFRRRGLKVVEVPFTFHARHKGRSKLLMMNPLDFIHSVLVSKLRNV